MKTFTAKDVDKKLTELIETINEKDLREAVRQRLKRNFHLVTGAILTNDENKICLVQEAKGPWAGKWNTPLGHLETDEPLPDAAKREVKEETGYDIKLVALLPPKNVTHENVFRVLYVGKVVGGSPNERLISDTSAVGWFTSAEIEQKLQAGELRDIGTWYDIVNFQNNPQLPLNTIQEAEYKVL